MSHIKVSRFDNLSKIAELAGYEKGSSLSKYDGKFFYIYDISQEKLDVAFREYKDNLEEYLYVPFREDKIATLRGEMITLFERFYDKPLKQRLLELLNTSSARGMKNRASYILQVFDWSDSIEQYLDRTKKKLDKLSCVHKILDFEMNLKKFESENPNVNLKDALEMKD
jgi:hypothetical protein|tara:strand:- start:282 stop:788 length:507 start_codon:yes stop_codon:yes gene_type:complete